jgi:hypothetical protein
MLMDLLDIYFLTSTVNSVNASEENYFPNCTILMDQTLTKLRFTRNDLTEDDKVAFKVTSCPPQFLPWFP